MTFVFADRVDDVFAAALRDGAEMPEDAIEPRDKDSSEPAEDAGFEIEVEEEDISDQDV
jgi:hypothetical protein